MFGGTGPGFEGRCDRPATKGEYGFKTIGLTVVGAFLGIIAPPTLIFTVPMVVYGGYKYVTTD